MHMPSKTGITYMLDRDSQSSGLPKFHQMNVANFVNADPTSLTICRR